MNDYPLVKFIIYFICGIILQSIWGIAQSALLFASILLIISTLALSLIYKDQFIAAKNILLALAIIFCSMLYYSEFKNEKAVYPFAQQKYPNVFLYGTVTNIELIRDERIIFNVESDSMKIGSLTASGKLKFICSLRDSKNKIEKKYGSLAVGNKVICKGNIFRARNERNPGEFDYEKYILEKGFSSLLIINNASNVEITGHSINAYDNFIFEIRKAIDKQILRLHNKTTGGLLRGLLLGDRSMIDYEIESEFVNAGVVHVLSVSGLHVGFIILIFVVMFKRFNVYSRFVFTFTGLLIYTAITYFQPPVTRSAIMGLALLSAPLSGRSPSNTNSLCLAALVILIFSPGDLFNPGFQLSFSAILAIIILYPPFSRYIYNMKLKSRVLKYILLFCTVSLAAQIGTLPFTLVYFHKLSLIALIANMFVIPLSGFVVGLGIFTIAIGTISNYLGLVYASANESLTFVLYWLVDFFGKLKNSFIAINQFSLYDGILFYVILAFIFAAWKKLAGKPAKIFVAALTLLSAALLLRIDNKELLPDGKLSVMAIDIGQGDSFLIKFPNGETALIDGGDANAYFDNGEKVIAPLLERLDIGKIDYGFISHVDSDHYRGLIYLIRQNKFRTLYKPKADSTLDKDVELEKIIREQKIPIKYYGKGVVKISNAQIYILNDTASTYFESFGTNDKSGMLKIVYGKTSFLFTGDAGAKAEKYYSLNYPEFLRSNVLKTGHHGSKTSTSPQFLNFVMPQFAIISSGILNKFNHPSPEIIERLKENNIEVFRTDKSGAILLQSDGLSIKNINWKNE
ncbi:MAG: DNA internalization-related competence protein ComEC/Rec2 [Ignavibacteriales bacterium]|nr:DNA internalization-related competence protein ComEC/Rec2 [Ignavibacteriales bacterium]